MATNEVQMALAEIRNVVNGLGARFDTMDQYLQAMDVRITTVQNNLATADARLTAHEGVHDPYINIVDALRLQMDNLGPQVTTVGQRLTALTDEMGAFGITHDTVQRIDHAETQVAAFASNMAQIGMNMGQFRAQTMDSMKTMANSLTTLQTSITTEYASIVTDLQDRLAKNDSKLAHAEIYLNSLPSAQNFIDLKSRVDNLDIQVPSNPTGVNWTQRVDMLEDKIKNLASRISDQGGLPSSSHEGGSKRSLEKQEAIKALTPFDNKATGVSFEKFTAVIKSQVDEVEEWQGILSWAQGHGKMPVDQKNLTVDQEQLGRKLWSLFAYKLEGDPWKQRRLVPEHHGLEIWRRLYDEYDPMDHTEATVLKVQLNKLPLIQGPHEVVSRIESLEYAIQRYNAMTAEVMSNGEMHSMLSRIAPPNFISSQLLAGHDVSTWETLRRQLMIWAKSDKAHKRITTGGSAPMEIGQVEVPPTMANNPESMAKILEGLQKSQAHVTSVLAALVKGGKGRRGVDKDGDSTMGASPGKGGDRGGGKPAAGKGPGSTPMVTLPGGAKIPLKKLRICRDFAKGTCSRKNCMFPHVSGLPASLQERALSNSGLTLCNLGLEPKAEGGTYTFDPAAEQQVLASLASMDAAKETRTAGSIEAAAPDEWVIEGMDDATLQALIGSGSPFGGPEA